MDHGTIRLFITGRLATGRLGGSVDALGRGLLPRHEEHQPKKGEKRQAAKLPAHGVDCSKF